MAPEKPQIAMSTNVTVLPPHRGAIRRDALNQNRNSSQAPCVPPHAIKSGLFEVA